MRQAFINEIQKQAEQNSDIIILTGDLGYSVFENFQQKLPKQFFNTGIAEQNMAGVAAGLALEGKKVFIYSIVPFATMRCYEQIRNDICYHNIDVNIIGIGGGFAYGSAGFTHQALEDLAIMRVLPNMKIICPCDPQEASILAQQVLRGKGPFYIRLNRGGEMNIYPIMPEIEIGKAAIARSGKDITIFGIGAILNEAMLAAEILEKQGISAEVVSMHTLKPFDKDIILDRVKIRKAIFSLEEHSVIGGLNSVICEVLAGKGIKILFKALASEDKYFERVGSQACLRAKAGLDAQSIADAVINALKTNK